MCELCFPKAIEIGELIKDYYLIYDTGVFSLLSGQGHNGDEELYFPGKPTIDLDPKDECVDVNSELFKEHDKWMDRIIEWWEDLRMTPESGYWLVKSAIESGWDRYENDDCALLEFWLVDKAAKMILEYEKSNNIELKPATFIEINNI